MVKLVQSTPGSLSRTFKNWLMELAETEMTFDILKRLRAESTANLPQATAQQVPQQEDPSKILSYVQILKELPEEDRQIAMALLQSLNSPPPAQAAGPPQPSMDPTLLMLMMLLKDGQKGGSDSGNAALAEAIKGQFMVLTEMIKTMGNRNDSESIKLLLDAIDKLKTSDDFKDEVARMAIGALMEAANSKGEGELDKVFSILEKLRSAGVIIDPQTSLTYQLEKEKMDKEFKLKEKQMEMEEKRMEQITQFLADLADALESLTEKEGEEGEKITKKPAEVTVNCPKCGSGIKVTTDMKAGTIIKCENCGAKLKLSWGRRED